ncbi:hypothetical protein D3C78_1111730 [compost metagenome]
MRPCTDVRSKINAPQACTIQFVRIHVYSSCISRLRVVLAVRWRPQHHDLIFAVAVQIADTRIACAVAVRLAILRISIGRLLNRHRQVLLLPYAKRLSCRLLHAVQDRGYAILRAVGASRIKVVGAARNQLLIHLHAVAIEVEADCRRIKTQQAPSDVVAAFLLHRYRCAVQIFHIAMQCRHYCSLQIIRLLRYPARID